MDATVQESEAVVRKEREEKRRHFEAFRIDKSPRISCIVADQEVEDIQQIEKCGDYLAPNPTLIHPGCYSPQIIFFDSRSPDSSDRNFDALTQTMTTYIF